MLFEKIQLEPNENVLVIARRHWFIIVSELFATVFMALVPLFILLILAIFPNFIPYNFHLETHLPIVTYGLSIWLLISTLAGFMIWTHYYLDLWVITDRRIILVDQIQFFNRKVSSFRLERLQDIQVTVSGIIPTFLNFGTIQAQTASASESNFKTTGLPAPRELQSTIQKAMDARLESLRGVSTEIISN
jgi:hypothetical protein